MRECAAVGSLDYQLDAVLSTGLPGVVVFAISPDASWVLDPVPGHPGETPTERLLTFTTCHPKYSASHRLVLFGKLTSAHRKAPGYIPPSLQAEG